MGEFSVEVLKEGGAGVDLCESAREGEMLEVLAAIVAEKDLEVEDEDGRTPLFAALLSTDERMTPGSPAQRSPARAMQRPPHHTPVAASRILADRAAD